MWLLMPSSELARRFVTGLAICTAAVFAAFIVAFGWDRIASPIPRAKAWFDIGNESNLPTWWNATLLILVAMCALVASLVADRARERRAWWVVALAGTYLSIDEATELHERLAGIGERSGLAGPTYAWLAPGIVVALAGATVLVIAGRALPRRAGARLGLALGIYAVAALGLEAVGGWIRDDSDDSPWFTIAIMLEEGLEMLACVLAVGAILDTLSIELDSGRISIAHVRH